MQKLAFALNTDLNYWHQAGQLLNRARQWETHHHHPSFALRGAELTSAERRLADGATKQPTLTALHTQFITASRRDAAQRQARTIGALGTGLIITLVLAVISFLLAVNLNAVNGKLKQTNAQLNADNIHFRSAALFAEAQHLLLNGQYDQAMLVAAEAANEDKQNSNTTSSLLSVLGGQPYLDTIIDNGTQTKTPSNFIKANQVSVSADGKYVFYAGANEFSVWDVAAKTRKTHVVEDPTDPNAVLGYDAAMSPDGQWVVSRGSGVYLWNAQTGAKVSPLLAQIAGSNFNVHNIAFSPDSQLVAATGCDISNPNCAQEKVYLWNVRTRALAGSLPLDWSSRDSAMAFSGDGKTLALTECDNSAGINSGRKEIALWNIQSQARVGTIPFAANSGDIHDVKFSPTGKLILVAQDALQCQAGVNCNRGVILTFDARTLALQGIDHEDAGYISHIAISPDGKHLISNVGDTGIRMRTRMYYNQIDHDLAENQTPIKDFAENAVASFTLNDIAFMPDSERFVTADSDGKVVMWRIIPYASAGLPLNEHVDGSSMAVFSPDGKILVTATAFQQVEFLECANAEIALRYSCAHL